MTDLTSPASIPSPRPEGKGLLGLLPLVARRRRELVLTILSGILAQGGTLASFAVGAWLVGQALTGAGHEALLPGMALLAGIVVVAAVARWWQAHISHDLAFALIETLQMGIFDGLERSAPAYLMGKRTGDLASVATGDAELMEHFYAHTVADYVGAVVVPFFALAALAFIHPVSAVALVPFLLLVASVPFWLARRAGEEGRAVLRWLGLLNADTVGMIEGLRELAIFGCERDFLSRVMRRMEAVNVSQRRYAARAGAEHAAIDMLVALSVLAAAVAGIWLLQAGEIDITQFPLVVVLAGAALTPIVDVTQTARKLGELRAGAERILTIYHQRAQIADTGTAEPAGDATVRFEGVGFDYGAGDRGAVLNGIDLTLMPGETVALVGRSGAGKTTCTNLLLRFWDPDKGRITIGGCDIRSLPVATLRRQVAYVPQEIHLFDETVADNIRLGVPDASEQAVEAAARMAQAHDFIADLPEGYETRCGPRGSRLSGGQRQRIAIARALATKAPILVLDEASSSLDAENEAAFHDALEAVQGARTMLVIAHRPSTIRRADRIVVLDKGRIVEEGTHDALMARGGVYADIVAKPEEMA